MNCQEINDLITHPHQLTPQQLEAFAAHFETCPECQALADEDPFADHPEWRRAFLEAFASLAQGQLPDAPSPFAQKMFVRVWPHVQRAHEKTRTSTKPK